MITHTPGPWYKTEGLISDSNGVHIATACDTRYENAEANARLIAAAPDLLEALKGINKRLHNMMGDIELRQMERIAQQAIAKAEGGEE